VYRLRIVLSLADCSSTPAFGEFRSMSRTRKQLLLRLIFATPEPIFRSVQQKKTPNKSRIKNIGESWKAFPSNQRSHFARRNVLRLRLAISNRCPYAVVEHDDRGQDYQKYPSVGSNRTVFLHERETFLLDHDGCWSRDFCGLRCG
jgi:alkylhydroperoxidase family enzyme